MQKAFTDRSDEVDPMKNAMQSVSDVIVIEGPACIIARLIRSDTGRWKGC